jgi:membrane protein YdbS with pleckstrin-like domain
MKYRIVGADRQTGEDVEIIIDAGDEVAAESAAVRRNVMVATVEAVRMPDPSVSRAPLAPADVRSCPYCGETVKVSAVKCKHCAADIGRGATFAQHSNSPSEAQTSETVIFEGPVSQWTNLGSFVFSGIIAIGGFVLLAIPDVPFAAAGGVWCFAGLVAFAAWFHVRFLVYRVTTERVEIERGWIGKSIENLDMFRVLDVRLSIGLFDRLVGMGNVNVISSDKTTPNVTIRGLPNARYVYDRLKREAVHADRRRGVLHVET